jgi:heme/copper-type cytochrome/quinol oxidase subunit 2
MLIGILTFRIFKENMLKITLVVVFVLVVVVMKFKRVNKDEGAGLYDNDVPH